MQEVVGPGLGLVVEDFAGGGEGEEVFWDGVGAWFGGLVGFVGGVGCVEVGGYLLDHFGGKGGEVIVAGWVVGVLSHLGGWSGRLWPVWRQRRGVA